MVGYGLCGNTDQPGEGLTPASKVCYFAKSAKWRGSQGKERRKFDQAPLQFRVHQKKKPSSGFRL
jgi:hypothetical protein